ncbi:MAG: hemerythrin domain-containing protein [Promethearchaeota archaeon]
MSVSIAEHFKSDHDQIIKILRDYFKSRGNPDENLHLIRTLIWTIDRHFYLEEKTLVQYLKLDPSRDFDLLFQFYSEHNEILDLNAKIKKNLEYDPLDTISPAITQLQNLVVLHKNFEMENFYYRMDEDLSEDERQTILKSLNIAANHGFYPMAKIRDAAKALFASTPELLKIL